MKVELRIIDNMERDLFISSLTRNNIDFSVINNVIRFVIKDFRTFENTNYIAFGFDTFVLSLEYKHIGCISINN